VHSTRDSAAIIRQLGTHDGKEIHFGYDRYLVSELDAYRELLGRHGTLLERVDGDELHYLSSARMVCERVRGNPRSVGILCCGTGMGMSIAANKFRQIYAARCVSVEDAQLARAINNANVLCIASSGGLALNAKIIEAFMRTAFEGRKVEQLAYISELELETDPAPGESHTAPRVLQKSA
jgi:ribose 5-phosphate isomerase B